MGYLKEIFHQKPMNLTHEDETILIANVAVFKIETF